MEQELAFDSPVEIFAVVPGLSWTAAAHLSTATVWMLLIVPSVLQLFNWCFWGCQELPSLDPG